MIVQLQMVTTFAVLAVVAMTTASCRQRGTNPSETRHLQGEFTIDAPPFFWTDIATAFPERFIQATAGHDGAVLPRNHALTERLQLILNQIDASARSLHPDRFQKIPKPIAVVINKNDVNAFVTARGICVKQRAMKEATSPTNEGQNPTPVATPTVDTTNWVLDLESPGFVFGTTLPDETTPQPGMPAGYQQDRCPIVEPEVIGWSAPVFIEHFNRALPPEKSACALKFSNDTILAPNLEECGYIADTPYQLVRFRAAANTVFFFTGLLHQMSETSVTTVAAHELAHYYRGHAVSVLDFQPFPFLQNRDNELRKPLVMAEHPELRQAMEDASSLATPKRTDGARLDANLYGYMMDFFRKLQDLCPETSTCFGPFQAMKAHAELPKAFELWSEIESKALRGDNRDYYLKFEQLFLELTKTIQVASLNDSWIERLTTDTPAHLKTYFPDIRTQPDLSAWFVTADRNITAILPTLREPFAKAAKLKIGFYSTEEEADEIGFELAARQGVTKPQVGALWTEFMAAQSRDGYEPGLRETDWVTCGNWYKNNWKSDSNQDVTGELLIDSLANIHHGLCYRLFNSQREWTMHGFDKLVPKSPRIAFDERRWRQLISESDLQTTNQDPSLHNPSSIRSARCVWAPHRPHLQLRRK